MSEPVADNAHQNTLFKAYQSDRDTGQCVYIYLCMFVVVVCLLLYNNYLLCTLILLLCLLTLCVCVIEWLFLFVLSYDWVFEQDKDNFQEYKGHIRKGRELFITFQFAADWRYHYIHK